MASISKVTTEKHKEMTKKLTFLSISLGLGLICTLLLTFVPALFSITLIPTGFRNNFLIFVLLSIIYFVLMIVADRFSLSKGKKYAALSIGIIVATILMVGVIYFVNTYIFFQSINGGSFSNRITYAVAVKKDSTYERITELDGKKIGLIDGQEEMDAISELEESLELDFNVIALDSGISELANKLIDGNVEAICIEQGRLNFLYDEIEGFQDDVRVIYTFKLRGNLSKLTDRKPADNKPFVIYISGIDQYGKTDSVVGRSDVNQLMIINPKTHDILIVNTPRDYYVQLSGTVGLRDKLTHAGIYGVSTSISTMEELYGIKIDYYIRVNFDSLINVVDQIGGIDINSDLAFKAYTDPGVYVQEGNNHFNGRQALAYTRERYAYESGDRHRGENQQQVMAAIINKISSSSVLLKNYNNILQSLTGSFQTNIPAEMMTELIGEQINEKTKWKISTISVDGSGTMLPTYSMGEDLPLYVMIPNEESLAIAKEEINKVLDGD